MHLYVMARGINDALKRWENDVSAIYCPIKYNENGVVKTGRVRTAVRPIQLYEIVFPEESLSEIMATIPDTSGKDYRRVNGLYKYVKSILIRIMKLTPAPENIKHNGKVFAPFVAVSHIGIKKDKRDSLGCELL